jgi:phosphate acetyltransferase
MNFEHSPFVQNLMILCRQSQRTIALPESLDQRVLAAGQYLLTKGLCRKIALFGPKTRILEEAERAGVDLMAHNARILWVAEEFPDLAEKTQNTYREQLQRRNKPLDEVRIATWGTSAINQAAFMVGHHHLDAGLAGCVAPTADVIRAALCHIGAAEGQTTISGSFAMIRERDPWPKARYLFADCGVVVDPSVDQLVDIAAATVTTFSQLFPDDTPKVSFLSFATKGSAKHPLQEKVAEATALFQARHPSVAADGELQFDAAVDPDVGRRKAPESPVAGYSNCFIFPDLDAGNIAYKMAQRLGFFDAYGPILQGTRQPFSDLSRGATAEDIAVMAMITMLRAEPGGEIHG